jgi:hypothetical protein
MFIRIIRKQTRLFFFCCCFSFVANAQKQINYQSLFWLASVNTIRFNQHWGVVADFSYRSFDFMAHPYSYTMRGSGKLLFQ